MNRKIAERTTIFVVIAVVLALTQMRHAKAQDSTNIVMTLEEFINTLAPEERAQAIKNFARMGIVLDLADFWEHVTEPGSIFRIVRLSEEPVGANRLDKLAAVFEQLTNPDDRFRAAAILYRYGRPIGREYLLQQLRGQTNRTAALIFAMNREEAVFDDLVTVFRRDVAEKGDSVLTDEFAAWKTPAAIELLLWAFARDPDYYPYGTALAIAGSQRAIPLIQSLYDKLPPDDDRRLDCAAALASLGVNVEENVNLLLQRMNDPEEPWARDWVIRRLAVAGGPRAIQTLAGLIEDFMTNQVDEADIRDRPEPSELAANAAKALSNLNAPGAADLLTRLLRSPAWETVALALDEKRETVANALFSVAGTNAQTVLREQMGNDWWQRKISTHGLKRLPAELLPGPP